MVRSGDLSSATEPNFTSVANRFMFLFNRETTLLTDLAFYLRT